MADYIPYILAAVFIYMIIRVIMYKPRPASDAIAQQIAKRERESKSSEQQLRHYPKGPFYVNWHYQEYNQFAIASNSKLKIEELHLNTASGLQTLYILTDKFKNHYGCIHYTFTMMLPNHDYTKLLLWKSDEEKRFIRCSMVDLDKVTRLPYFTSGNIPGSDWYFNPDAVINFKFGINPSVREYTVEIPEQVSQYFPEIITIEDIPGLYGKEHYGSNTAIMILNTKKQKLSVYPQDWFNKQHLDFGYQWLMRARRLPSKEITVEGVRMGYFILDGNYTGLANNHVHKTYVNSPL